MRTLLGILSFCLLATLSQAQRNNNNVEISHYIFPEFAKGTVLMKSGVKNEAMMNYNALTEEMIFESAGRKLAMNQLEQIDTVYLEKTKFVVLKGKFVEQVYDGKYKLYAEHKCSIIDPGKPAAYGGTSQTSATTSYSSFFANGQAYELQLPGGFKTKPYTQYWLNKDGKLGMFLNIRQLSKLFDDKAALVKQFAKENKVEYENRESLVGLIKFLEKN